MDIIKLCIISTALHTKWYLDALGPYRIGTSAARKQWLIEIVLEMHYAIEKQQII